MTFPSQFRLVATLNPTPDGKMPGESRSSPREIQNYLARISGPLLDRIDLHVEVPQVKFQEISAERTGGLSATIRERVIAARKRQQERFSHMRAITCNARMGPRELKTYCAGRSDQGTVEIRHGRFEFERPRLRPGFESGTNDCRYGERGKNRQRPHFRGNSIPFAGSAVVDLTFIFAPSV